MAAPVCVSVLVGDRDRHFSSPQTPAYQRRLRLTVNCKDNDQ